MTFFSLFIALLPLTAQEDERPLAYLLRENDSPISHSFVCADNRYDSRYAGKLPACPEETNGRWIADVTEGSLTDLTERFGKPLHLLLPN